MLITVAPAPERQTRPVLHQALISRVSLSGQFLNAFLVKMDPPQRQQAHTGKLLCDMNIWLVFFFGSRQSCEVVGIQCKWQDEGERLV